jgi:hypothetical protein
VAADQRLERFRVAPYDESFQQLGISRLAVFVPPGGVAEAEDDGLKLIVRHGIPLAAVNVLFSPSYFPQGDDLLRDFSSGPSPARRDQPAESVVRVAPPGRLP